MSGFKFYPSLEILCDNDSELMESVECIYWYDNDTFEGMVPRIMIRLIWRQSATLTMTMIWTLTRYQTPHSVTFPIGYRNIHGWILNNFTNFWSLSPSHILKLATMLGKETIRPKNVPKLVSFKICLTLIFWLKCIW